MVNGTVIITVDRGVGLPDAAWIVVQTVTVMVIVGSQKAWTGDGKGVNPTFPADSSTFQWKCDDDEERLQFTLCATMPLRSLKVLGFTDVISIGEAVQRSEHGPAQFEVMNRDKVCGHLYARVEFTPELPTAPEQAPERTDSAPP